MPKFLIFLIASLAVTAHAELLRCVPTRYADGDTFTFLDDEGRKVRVRVAGFDAPERKQPFSSIATAKLRELTEGGATCDCYKQDRYGRSVCTVTTLAGHNVATEMLQAGLGCIDPRFEKEAKAVDREAGRVALKDAQASMRGMWSMPPAVCAFEFRAQGKPLKS